MKKIAHHILLAVVAMLIMASCSSNLDNKELPLFDFGTTIYEEPFVGILESKPNILVKSMQYLPYKWVVSDTTHLEKTFEITFNEESLRSQSEATLMFRDLRYNPIKDITFYYNGKICQNGELTIKADEPVKTVNLSLVISPSLKDVLVEGCLLIKGTELDFVNEHSLVQESNLISNWQCDQGIEWPIMLWLLWLLTIILIIILLLTTIYFIVHRFAVIVPYMKSLTSFKVNTHKTVKQKFHKKEKDNKLQEEKKKESDNWRWRIQRETGWSDTIIYALRSEAEARIYINAKLKEAIIAERHALIQPKINGKEFNCRAEWLKSKPNYNEWKDWNNDDLMGEGYPPRDKNGDPYELHHIGQHQDSPFAELSWKEHMSEGNNMILHPNRISEINRQDFETERAKHWMARCGY